MPILTNPMHERFAQIMAVTHGGRSHKREAMREAYPLMPKAMPNPSDQQLSELASRTLANERVQNRIQELKNGLDDPRILPRLQAVVAHKVALTLEKAIAEADEIQQAAMKEGNHSAAVAALTAKAKLAGIWIDKSESTSAHYAISDKPLSNDEWRRKWVDGATTTH